MSDCIDVDCLPKDPEHERVEQELAKAVNRIRSLEAAKAELLQRNRILSNQLRGGDRDCDPRTDVDHPGHVLIELGWEYLPDEPDEPDDEIGAYWYDPIGLRETGKHGVMIMPLPMALGIACRRLAGLRTKRGDPRSWLDRVNDDG